MKKTRDKKERLMACPPRVAKHCGRGFTLLELMISISILVIMISVAIISLMPARNQSRLKAVQAEVATTIKMIQSNALQGKVTSGGVPAGYGFKITGGYTYQTFYCEALLCGDSNQDHPMDLFSTQDRGVTLASSNGTRFYFDIPNGRLSPEQDMGITLSLGGVSKNITVKKSGAVYEDN